jgi:hypothetical protein
MVTSAIFPLPIRIGVPDKEKKTALKLPLVELVIRLRLGGILSELVIERTSIIWSLIISNCNPATSTELFIDIGTVNVLPGVPAPFPIASVAFCAKTGLPKKTLSMPRMNQIGNCLIK